ncbi:aldose 1-epimerase family protein [Brachybacterium saurashtrense]|uniref:Galactose mutarotase n=1 Tax=Brachybacterium saurashtrense TaxID=556288 RepID=A0A345YLM4_9MICO|nr:aldose 1-epimerase family protein [Brachybacterium saurashtrense]AXK44826.1 galactose mutarotase [Brachybacterium saurashtrense]RRR20802.1 galactose mutarotase [Brachybacterium saurashtrense]
MTESPTVPTASGPSPRDRGELYTLTAGAYRAEVSAVGATLESLTVDGRDLLLRSPETGPMLFYRGAIVAPWPNRIGDGTYTWDGQELRTALTEPERGNALHGLVSFQAFTPASVSAQALELRTELFPSPGYPFHLLLTVRYTLEAQEGLRTTVTARNLGRQDAPYGVCPHPYLVAGEEPLEQWSLQVEAGTVLTVTEDRLLPTGTRSVEPGGAFDFRSARPLGSLFIDHAFTDLGRDGEGRMRVTVTAPGGTGVELTAGTECPWLQIHTGDRPEPEHHRRGLAVEPMTCPPDAFRSGTDVVRLAPGAEHSASWSLTGW